MNPQYGVKALIIVTVTVLLPLATAFSSGLTQRESVRTSTGTGTPLFSSSSNSASDSSSSEMKLPFQNEFSRPLQTERILRARRDYLFDLEASAEERQALATRFDLTDIGKLEASLKLRQESIGGKGRSSGVEVDGTVFASVTQRCVRTNEDFIVDLEFPLYCIVRPVMPLLAMLHGNMELPADVTNSNTNSNSNSNTEREEKSNGKPRKNKNTRDRNLNIGEMNMMQLQRMLQVDISDEDDVLMEDEAIYPTDGALDVGELVAQLFWLKLDPYPKRPGSDFVAVSISG
jgi:hypothetical protein